ncbi:MAG TPA: 3-deoxy-manno-octulosonate cytidylyltransferase [Acidisarcina sp.]
MPGRARVVAVIPARLASTRLPRKVLRQIAGEPMLAWVYRAARACAQLDDVLIATDSAEVLDLAAAHGWSAMLTPADCASGTDRIHFVAQSVPADIYVNVQGDEPLLRPAHIDSLLEPMLGGAAAAVSTLATPCPGEDVSNPNVVKVTVAADGRALYFSRAAIPFNRDGAAGIDYLKHLGLYAYRAAALRQFPTLPPSRLEAAERLEQLRFLENGIPIHVAITPHDTIGVDTEADLRAVEALLLARPQPRRK